MKTWQAWFVFGIGGIGLLIGALFKIMSYPYGSEILNGSKLVLLIGAIMLLMKLFGKQEIEEDDILDNDI